MIVEFIRTYQGRREAAGLAWGVEPICADLRCTVRAVDGDGLPIGPSTYSAHVLRLGRSPSRRQVREEHLEVEIKRVHAAPYGVYGARKVWLQLNREGIPVARWTVERLMRRLDLHGPVRGKVKRTTVADRTAKLPEDLVQRHFTPRAPNRLWVADITYVSTWSGWVYVAFDNALAETINGLFKTELIKRRGPWRGVDHVEIATAEWVDRFNHRRLYEYCGDVPPAEMEAAHYAQIRTQQHAALSNR